MMARRKSGVLGEAVSPAAELERLEAGGPEAAETENQEGATPPEETAAPAEPIEAQEPAPEAEPEESQQIPRARLKEEAEKRRKAEAEAQELREKFARADERMQVLTEAMQQPREPVQPAPNYDDDPLGSLKHRLDQQDARLQRYDQFFDSQSQHAERAQQVQQINTQVQVQEQAFRETNPDYDDAVSYLLKARDAELQMFGYDDPVQRQAIIRRDADNLCQGAISRGQNVAETVYKWATSRGYAPTEKAPTNGAASPQPGKIATVRQGQQAATSLAGSGSQQTPPLTVESLADMSDDDFAKLDKKVRDRLLGK